GRVPWIFLQQKWNGSGMPVMDMNHIRRLLFALNDFQYGPVEKSIALGIVWLSINLISFEVAIIFHEQKFHSGLIILKNAKSLLMPLETEFNRFLQSEFCGVFFGNQTVFGDDDHDFMA